MDKKQTLQDRKLFQVAYYYEYNACEIITVGAFDKFSARIIAVKIFRKKYNTPCISYRQLRV